MHDILIPHANGAEIREVNLLNTINAELLAVDAPEKKKRKRRTKAEMEAVKEKSAEKTNHDTEVIAVEFQEELDPISYTVNNDIIGTIEENLEEIEIIPDNTIFDM